MFTIGQEPHGPMDATSLPYNGFQFVLCCPHELVLMCVSNGCAAPCWYRSVLTGIKLWSAMAEHATKARGGSVIISLLDG